MVGSRFDFFTEGQEKISFSSQTLKLYQGGSLGELLGACGETYVKFYGGAGSLGTLSIRGASANQTQVNWNGFPLNSPTTGDADLSLIPVYLINELNILPGASGSLYGSGTFGGSVDISSKVRYASPFSVFFDSEIGSFHNRSLSAGFSHGSAKLNYSLSFSVRNVLNDYTFVSRAGTPESTMAHNSLKYMGIFQNISYNLNEHNSFELGIWYQQKMKDLPLIMGAYLTSFASQKDSSLKIFSKWAHSFYHSSLTVKSAYFTDYLHYTDQGYNINSQIFSRQFLSDISYRNYFSEHFSSEAGIVSRLITADVTAYGSRIFEPRVSVYSASKLSLHDLIVNVSIRSEFTKYRQPKPVFTIAASYNLIDNILNLRIASSTKYRLPSLNEKYWSGCNPNILPEEGWTNEAGFHLNIFKKTFSTLSLDVQAYSSRMNNLIQWIDTAAVNFKAVWSRGIDGHLLYKYTGELAQFESSLGLEHLRSTNTQVNEGREDMLGKQLRYVPSNRMNFMSQLNYSVFNFTYFFALTGRTFVNEDNSGLVLPAYAVSTISVAAGKKISGNDYSLSFRIANLFDEHYQVISGFPAPGRAFYLGLSVRFNVNKKPKNTI